jgi:hypothetical protein
MAAARDDSSLMRNIGAFFGHIIDAIYEKAPDSEASTTTTQSSSEQPIEVQRDVQEAKYGDYILTRTTIDEVRRADTKTDTSESKPCQ